jgi:hypothetical protein
MLAGYIYTRHSSRGEGSVNLGPAILFLEADDILRVIGTAGNAAAGTAKTIASASGILVKMVSDPNPGAGIGGCMRAWQDGVIEQIAISKGFSGVTGTTEIDILRNGASISDSLGFNLGWSDMHKTWEPDSLGDVLVGVGDSFTIQPIREEYQSSPMDLVVQIKIRATGA